MENHSQGFPFSHDSYLEYPALLVSQGSPSKPRSALRFIIHTLSGLIFSSPENVLAPCGRRAQRITLYWKQGSPQFFAVQTGTISITCVLIDKLKRVAFSCLNMGGISDALMCTSNPSALLWRTGVSYRHWILYVRPIWMPWLPWGHF